MKLGPREEAFIQANRVARLATTSEGGEPHVIPICYAYDNGFFYTAVDEKPKKVAPERLKRVRNIVANPRVALVVDVYTEDWRKLAFVLVLGTATILDEPVERRRAVALLRDRYEQYAHMDLDDPGRPIIKVTPTKVTAWGAL